MELKLQMNLSNAAYLDYAPYPEPGELVPEAVAADLEKVAQKIRAGETSGNIIDYNGNCVGYWEIISVNTPSHKKW